MCMNTTYTQDYHQWAHDTVRLLRERRWQDVDVEHLIEEIEDLGKSERRGITSQLTRLLLHLLKWQYQPKRCSDSWLDSITDARLQIELAIQDSPSLQAYPSEQFAQCYLQARRSAARQTGLSPSIFPTECPYDLADVLYEDWLPE